MKKVHDINSRLIRFVSLLFVVAILAPRAHADDRLSNALQEFLGNEQGRMSRSVDRSKLKALTNLQDQRYAPEQGNTFRVKSYWVDASRMHSFEGIGMSAETKSLFTRTYNGKKQVRLLVHPESAGLYQSLAAKATRASDFMATATASSRTLVAWPVGQPSKALFAKLSLDKMIGGVRRTISQGEVARSVGINDVLALSKQNGRLPSSFKYIPETFSSIPRGMSEGGMIIREIPKEMSRGDKKYVPMFSLYAQPKGGGKPMLVDMINKSNMDPATYVREKIIRPFAKQWVQLSIMNGINAEPHGQNLLIELDKNNQPTGKFIHRDFGGFDIDFSYRKQAKLPLPKTMPTITSLEKDYKVNADSAKALRKLDTFFWGGLAYNLDKDLPSWKTQGLLKAKGSIAKGDIRKMLYQELETQYTNVTGQKVSLNNSAWNLKKMLVARTKLNTITPKARMPLRNFKFKPMPLKPHRYIRANRIPGR